MVRAFVFAALAIAPLAAACGAAADTSLVLDPGDPLLGDEPPAPALAPPPAAPVRATTGLVERPALDQVLDAGPGAFLAGMEVTPRFVERRFVGWEIVRFWPGDRRFAGVDLRPGDVVSAVNGRGVARPDQVQVIWEELRTAEAIIVAAHRAGQPFELRFQVVGDR
jgi:S1-C subfamily serine protease